VCCRVAGAAAGLKVGERAARRRGAVVDRRTVADVVPPHARRLRHHRRRHDQAGRRRRDAAPAPRRPSCRPTSRRMSSRTASGELRVAAFTRGSGRDVRKALAALRAKHVNRDRARLCAATRAGLLDEGVQAASGVPRRRDCVSYRGRGVESKTYAVSGHGDTVTPLVVLVDAGTASAAEVVAGALQDRTAPSSSASDVRQGLGAAADRTVGRLRARGHRRALLHAVGTLRRRGRHHAGRRGAGDVRRGRDGCGAASRCLRHGRGHPHREADRVPKNRAASSSPRTRRPGTTTRSRTCSRPASSHRYRGEVAAGRCARRWSTRTHHSTTARCGCATRTSRVHAGTWTNHEPRAYPETAHAREEIAKLIGKTKESGLALVPLQLYFRDGRPRSRSRSRGAASRTTSARRWPPRDATREVAPRARPPGQGPYD